MSDDPRRDRRLAWAVLLLSFGVWMLAASRDRPWGDAEVMFRVAEAIVERGEIQIEYLWPPMSHRGVDGRIFSQYALLPSLVHVPGALALELAGPELHTFLWPVAAQFGASLAAAIACMLWFWLARCFEVRAWSSFAGALVVGFATMLSVYARRPFSEALQVATMLGMALALVRFVRAPSRRAALWVGVAGGLLVNAKLVFALSLIVGLGQVLVSERETRAYLAWIIIGGVPFALMLFGYNLVRWGSPVETGYGATLALANESLFWGLFGLLLSPGKSVLLYNPLLLLTPPAMRAMWQPYRRECWLLLALVLPPMIYYGRFLNWGGGWGWGPRYWLFAVPVLLLPVCWWLDRGLASNRRRVIAAFALVLALAGFGVNTVGNAFHWDDYIRIARRTQMKWLGKPNRTGAVIDAAGRGHCDSCIEDTYSLLWLPQFSPIVGHTWLLRHVAAGDDWATAQTDAPWSRHTDLDMDIPDTYHRAQLDWWPLMWSDEHRKQGRFLMFLLVIPLALGGGLLSAAWRSRST